LLPDGQVVLCCVSGDDEVEHLVTYLPGDLTATTRPAPEHWGRGPLVALADGRIVTG
jgi:hypothetical protein